MEPLSITVNRAHLKLVLDGLEYFTKTRGYWVSPSVIKAANLLREHLAMQEHLNNPKQ